MTKVWGRGKMRFRLVFIAGTAGLVSACATDPYNNAYYEFNYKIQQGMTESSLVTAFGYRPSEINMQTCGTATPTPWQCKVYIYKISAYPIDKMLIIFFRQGENGSWIVNNWHNS